MLEGQERKTLYKQDKIRQYCKNIQVKILFLSVVSNIRECPLNQWGFGELAINAIGSNGSKLNWTYFSIVSCS